MVISTDPRRKHPPVKVSKTVLHEEDHADSEDILAVRTGYSRILDCTDENC